MKNLRDYLFVLLLFLAINHLFFHKILSPNHVIFGTDTQAQSQIFGEYTQKEVEKGDFPYWTNHILGGMPTQASFFTNHQLLDKVWGVITYPLFLPANLIIKLFHLPGDYAMVFWFAFFGFFMFLYLRELNISKLSSFIAAISFMSCTGFVSLFYPGHVAKATVIGLLPLILFFLQKAFSKGKVSFFLFASLIYARTMVMHIQIFFLLSVSLLIYLFLKILFDYLDKKDLKRVVKFVVLSGLLFVMGIMLNADQLLPRMEFKKYTHRGAESSVSQMDKAAMSGNTADMEKYYFVTSFSQPPEDLLGLFMRYPFGMGKPYGGVLKEVEDIPYYRGRYELRLSLEYVGIFVFLLSILGAIKFFKEREVKIIIILGITSLLLSLGKYTILFDVLYKMPGFRNFRIPLVYIMASYFSFAALSGFGFQAIEDYINKNKNGVVRKFLFVTIIIAIVLTLLAVIGTVFEIHSIRFLLSFDLVQEMLWGVFSDVRQRFALFMFNLYYLVISLWLFGASLFFVYKKKISLKGAFVFFLLAISIDLWSLNNKFIIPIPKSENVSQYMGEDNLVKFLKADKSFFRIKSSVDEINNRWLLFNISNIEGYHPTPLKYFEDLYSLMNFTNNIDSLLNIKYLILSPQDPLTNILENNAFLKRKYRKVTETTSYSISSKTDKPVVIYENTMNYGRAFFVYAFGIVEDENQALGILANPTYNPKEVAILNEKPKQSFSLNKGSMEKIEFVKYEPNRVELITENDGNGLLIFSENWYPAWKAYIDGNKTELIRAYNTLRAVFVPAGKHKIEFRYESDTHFYGQVLFYIGLVLVVLAISFEFYKGRKEN